MTLIKHAYVYEGANALLERFRERENLEYLI